MRRWTIQQVSQELGIPASKIRFWEREIPSFKIPRGARGHRYFTDREVQTLRLIHHLREEKKIPLEQIGPILEDHLHPFHRQYKLIEELKSIRRFLVDLISELDGS